MGNMAAAPAAVQPLKFCRMGEAELQQWVEANPGRVNDRDSGGVTPIVRGCSESHTGRVVAGRERHGSERHDGAWVERSPCCKAHDIINVLLDRGVDPTRVSRGKWSPLMSQANSGNVELVARLLQDPRVRAAIDMQDEDGITALHHACRNYGAQEPAAAKVHLLLQAGASAIKINADGQTPLDVARQQHPTNHATIALLEQAPNAEKASLLVKARRLAVAANGNTVAPSCMQRRVARGQPLPRVALMPLTDEQNNGEGEEEEGEEARKLRTTLAFLCGVGRDGMPRDVFRVVLDLLMLS